MGPSPLRPCAGTHEERWNVASVLRGWGSCFRQLHHVFTPDIMGRVFVYAIRIFIRSYARRTRWVSIQRRDLTPHLYKCMSAHGAVTLLLRCNRFDNHCGSCNVGFYLQAGASSSACKPQPTCPANHYLNNGQSTTQAGTCTMYAP